jgi:hypothetical protein
MSENKARHKPGLYTASVVETTIGKLGNKGNNALVLLCQLVEHTDHAGFKTAIDGNELVRVTVWLTAKTLGNQVTQDQLGLFGRMPQVLADLSDNKFVGKEVSLYCKLEDNAEGDTYSNFSISTGRGVGTNLKEKASSDDIRKLMALCGGGGASTTTYEAPVTVVNADDF